MNEYLEKDYTLYKIFNKIKGHSNEDNNENEDSKIEIVLPFFQREFKWNPKQQKEMLASFLLKIPIGSFLLIKGSKKEYKNKMIGFKNLSVDLDLVETDCLYLLDGQQRITSLYTVFNDYINELIDESESNESFKYRTVEKELRNRWYLDFNPEEEPIDKNIFGLKYLNFKKGDLYKKEPSDILDYIVNKNVKKSKDKEWYHPINDRNEIIEYYAPLYSVYDCFYQGSEKLKFALDDISEKIVRKMKTLDGYRCEELWDEVFEHLFKRDENMTKNIFIEEYRENDKIDEKFTELKVSWRIDILDYFEERFCKYELSVFQLSKNEINRAITIFEHMNLGGVKLDTFDLIVAKSAKDMDDSLVNLMYKIQDEFEENMDIEFKEMNIFESGKQYNSPRVKEQFLNVLSILNTLSVLEKSTENKTYKNFSDVSTETIKKKQILKMKSIDVKDNYEAAFKSILKSLKYMNLNFGIKKITDISYILMLLPISLVLNNYDDIYNIDNKVDDKIKYWYWASLFGGRYSNRQNRVAISDTKKLYSWCFTSDKCDFLKEINAKKKVLEVEDYSKFETLISDDCPKSVERSIYQYILSKEPIDLYGEKKLKMDDILNNKITVEKHHIITKKKFDDMNIKNEAIINTPLNITPTLRETNNDIKDKDFKNYSKKLKHIKNETVQGNYLRSDHFIETAKKYELKNLDGIKVFYKDRFKNLQDNINGYLKELSIE